MSNSEGEEGQRPSVMDLPAASHPLDEFVAQQLRRWSPTDPYSERRREPDYIHWAFERQ